MNLRALFACDNKKIRGLFR